MMPRPSDRLQRVEAARGVRRDGRLARLVCLTFFAYYLLTSGGHHYSIDGILMFESARQLAFRHSFVLDPPVTWGGEVIRVNRFSPGFTLAYLPALALASPALYWMPSWRPTPYDPTVAHNPELYGNVAYLLCAWLNPLIVALTGSLVFVIARRLGLTPCWAVIAALVYGVASPAAAYARYDFSQPLAGLALTVAAYVLIDAASTHRLRPIVTAGAALGAMFATRPELGVLIAWVGVWLGIQGRRSGARAIMVRMATLATVSIPALAFYFWLNHVRYGDWTRTGYPPLTRLFWSSIFLQGAAGLLLSPGHGLLIFYPLSWLALPGLRRLVKEHHAVGMLWSGLIAASFLLYACFRWWWAGWSWGPRLLIPIVPLLTVAATFWAARGRARTAPWRVRLFAALATLGVVVAWNGILFDVVLFYRWSEKIMGRPDSAATQFDPAASPLVLGWRFLATTSSDLLLLRMGDFAGRAGTAAAVVIASALIGCLVWSARRIRATLREDGAGGPTVRS
jgi:hypothetical protein